MARAPQQSTRVLIGDGDAVSDEEDTERSLTLTKRQRTASSGGAAAVPASRIVTPLYEVDTQQEDGGGGVLCGRGIISGDTGSDDRSARHASSSREKYASLCGVVMRIDRLTWVQHPRGRYAPKVGDVVVGVVREVVTQRMGWRVDVNASRDAMLMLAAMSDVAVALADGSGGKGGEPSGDRTGVDVQFQIKRRMAADDPDALELSHVLKENECVSCEVQQASHGDGGGTAALHTRSAKYGRLSHGQLVRAPCALIRRMKQHFHQMDCGVKLIIGCNGYIWVGCPRAPPATSTDGAGAHRDEAVEPCDSDARRVEARVAFAIRKLVEWEELIHPEAIEDEMCRLAEHVGDV